MATVARTTDQRIATSVLSIEQSLFDALAEVKTIKAELAGRREPPVRALPVHGLAKAMHEASRTAILAMERTPVSEIKLADSMLKAWPDLPMEAVAGWYEAARHVLRTFKASEADGAVHMASTAAVEG